MQFVRLVYQLFISLILLEVSPCESVPVDGEETSFTQGQALIKDGGPTMRDLPGARRHFEQAADAGHIKASGMLGYMLAAGLGGPKDEQRAVALIRKAANAGIESAQLNLGIMMLNGSGTPRDPASAIALLEMAAAKGSIQAHQRLGDLYYFGANGIPADYSRALPHVKATADGGNPDARNVLGTMFEFGQGTATSHHDAIHWYRKAAEQNHAKAQSNLARIIRIRGTRNTDVVEAYKWVKLAADQGEITAQTLLSDWEKDISAVQKAAAEIDVRQFRAKSGKQDPSAGATD